MFKSKPSSIRMSLLALNKNKQDFLLKDQIQEIIVIDV